jgi:hypothetical protein
MSHIPETHAVLRCTVLASLVFTAFCRHIPRCRNVNLFLQNLAHLLSSYFPLTPALLRVICAFKVFNYHYEKCLRSEARADCGQNGTRARWFTGHIKSKKD